MQCKEKLSVAAPTPSADLATAKNLVNNGGANGGDDGVAAPEVASTVQSPSGNGIDQGEPTESPIGSVAGPPLCTGQFVHNARNSFLSKLCCSCSSREAAGHGVGAWSS